MKLNQTARSVKTALMSDPPEEPRRIETLKAGEHGFKIVFTRPELPLFVIEETLDWSLKQPTHTKGLGSWLSTPEALKYFHEQQYQKSLRQIDSVPEHLR